MSPPSITDLLARPPAEATRRDVAIAALQMPAEQAIEEFPVLRRQLTRADNPLTEPFLDSLESTLEMIREGAATIGDVRRFVEATGTEPVDMLPNDLFAWPDSQDRGPVAQELHRRLVDHLESLVVTGDIDPDRLAAGDEEAWDAYVDEQRRWLHTPIDGQEPYWAVMDEEDAAFDAEWEAADGAAIEALDEILGEVGERPLPRLALRNACENIRHLAGSGMDDRLWPLAVLADAEAGVDDRDYWIAAAAESIQPSDMPPTEADLEAVSAWMALNHADWVGAVGTLARLGPGTPAGAADLADYVLTSPDLGEAFDDLEDARMSLEFGLLPVVELWLAVEAVDSSYRLTDLGWWGLPEALRRTWSS